MKRTISLAIVFVAFLAFSACNDTKKGNEGDKPKDDKKETVNDIAPVTGKETPASIAKRWCDLNAIANKAAYGPEQEKAEKALRQFEDDMEAKYKNDEAFMKEVEKEVEKCEGDSEK